jgi:SAM-dependent methyltransferase
MDFLLCPDCGEALTLTTFQEERISDSGNPGVKKCKHFCAFRNAVTENGSHDYDCRTCYLHEIRSGIIVCNNGHPFPIVDSIPRMLPDAFYGLDNFIEGYRHRLPMEQIEKRMKDREVSSFIRIQKSTKESFGYQWLRYDVESEEEDRKIFLQDSQLSEKELKNKIILDAGCGMGRYTRVAGSMGGEILAVDLSQSILKAYQKTKDNPCAHIVQADLLNLPFREKQFDLIYSLGVLHHTPDPRQAFLNLAHCLNEGGIVAIWVYGTAGKFRNFATNPLRDERRRYIKSDVLQRVHWLTVALREKVFNGVRLLTTRMYLPLLYLLCYPLAALGKIPLLKYLTASVHGNWRVRLQENFDWFSPRYQSHHTKEEVEGWFHEVKLGDIAFLQHGFIPKVGLRGRLK